MEQYVLRLTDTQWTYLGGREADAEEAEVVVRAFDGPVDAVTGSSAEAPDGEPVTVPTGEGRRLTGRHFFVRPGDGAGAGTRVSHRGLHE